MIGGGWTKEGITLLYETEIFNVERCTSTMALSDLNLTN